MGNLANQIATILSQVQHPGDFYASGTLDMHPFQLQVEGIGPIAMPLLPAQAEQLVALAEQAPYGRGPETLVDTEVRRTWQLDATKLLLSGRRWAEDLEQAVRQVKTGLGAHGTIEAELYKLLIYDAGSFFVSHRDTEKAPGMFATLVMVLPSPYTGGELIIRHKDHEVRLDLRRDEPSEVAFAAFYADCRHEVQPVASGHRLALVYNLIRTDDGPLPQPPDHDSVRAELVDRLSSWQGAPNKLVLPLEHAYTQAELGFHSLKGVDASVASLLLDAARAAECDLHLGLVTVYEQGSAEYTGGGWYGDAVDMEVGEVIDEGRYIHHWRSSEGEPLELGHLDFADDEVSPPDAFAGFEDIEPDFEEATGNAGASYERTYQCAALVIWPRAHRALVLVDAGLNVSVPYLSDLIERWRAAGGVSGDEDWQQAHGLALAIRDAWPSERWQAQSANKAGHGAALLGALNALGDPGAAAEFVATPMAAGAYDEADNARLAELLSALPAAGASELLAAVVKGNARVSSEACAALLAHCVDEAVLDTEHLRPAATALLSGLPGAPQPEDEPSAIPRWRAASPSKRLVAETLRSLDQVDPVLAEQALGHFRSDTERYPMDGILLAAALSLVESAVPMSAGSATASLRDAVLAHLEQRIAEPLEPPADWRRSAELRCRCQHCKDLGCFLASPTESVWRLKAVQEERSHVEGAIQWAHCDLDCTTDKRGRPYTLVCTKNQASYERRVGQREQDLADRERLR
jgi:predicted 2-oxoglutarate/Fe(II)-dependent dioxygenase YbiX